MHYDTAGTGHLSQDNMQITRPSMIHAVGLFRRSTTTTMAANGVGLVWSPRSNITLYGDTARVCRRVEGSASTSRSAPIGCRPAR